MKIKAIFSIILLGYFSTVSAQNLVKTYINDTLMTSILSEFIEECASKDPMYKHKGVVQVYIHPFLGGEKRIELFQSLDDSFKNMPPRKYAHFSNKIIVFYEYDENDKYIHNFLSQNQINFLLEEVGDRVFIAQTQKGRWVEKYESDGSLKSRNYIYVVNSGGSLFSIVYVINEKTGEIQKLKTL